MSSGESAAPRVFFESLKHMLHLGGIVDGCEVVPSKVGEYGHVDVAHCDRPPSYHALVMQDFLYPVSSMAFPNPHEGGAQ
ncbi:MAG: hypothetical protein ACYYK0_03485 [Candidatus Eutrophobiaceae bacterium]